MSSGTLEGLLATYRVDPEFIAEGLAIEVLEQAIAIMRAHDVSKAELARRLGISRSAVSQMFEKGGNLTMLTMARLASALGTELRVGLGEPVQSVSYVERDAWQRAPSSDLTIEHYASSAIVAQLPTAA